MNIAIIGSGNVGGSLAEKWADKGHTIIFGVRDEKHFKGKELVGHPNISFTDVPTAVASAEVVVLATPAPAAIEVAKSLGDTTDKIIIDTANIVMGKGPEGFSNSSDAVLANTQSWELVKCFNTTGYNNIRDTYYGDTPIDTYMCGDSKRAKKLTRELALEAGFAECYDVGGNDKFTLMEQFAWFWINLAMFQGQGREVAFKLLRRHVSSMP